MGSNEPMGSNENEIRVVEISIKVCVAPHPLSKHMSNPNCVGCVDDDQKHALWVVWNDLVANPPTDFGLIGQLVEWDDSRLAVTEVKVGRVYYYDYCAVCTLSPPDQDGNVWACTGNNIVQLDWMDFYEL
jgi:hypothetical protein